MSARAEMAAETRTHGTGGEQPRNTVAGPARFGSDVVAETLRDMGIPYIALNPGASFRGLHDSLVNHLGNTDPQLLLCLHEEHAVSIAHGYAKVTGRPMAAAVHANVGLMHATMAIFNAWCDRMPVVVLGATGPLDAAERRPWIDWIHTATDQGALVRHYIKWDDQPTSPAAARMGLLRAGWLASTAPKGPVYINLDAGLQEAALTESLPPLDAQRHLIPAQSGVSPAALDEIYELLRTSKSPVILMGRVSRDAADWARRVALAEQFGARVITDLKTAAAFPTTHPLYAGDLRGRNGAAAQAALAKADLVLALDWVDLDGALRAANPEGLVIRVTLDHTIHNGWSMDHQAHPRADLTLACDPDAFAAALCEAGGIAPKETTPTPPALPAPLDGTGPLRVETVAQALRHALDGAPACLTHVPLSWDGGFWPFEAPLDYLGSDGGGGLGAGPSHGIGAALALRDMGSDRIPIAICGDGDLLMGITALWTAVHYDIPLLVVVANNRSFFNDEVHQEKMARMRGRPVGNKWIGMRMTQPDIAIAAMAAAQGCDAFGPVKVAEELEPVLREALARVRAGRVAVVEVIVEAGYPPSLVAALTPGKDA